MTALLKYDAARQALAECKLIDEVKDIRDKAEAMRTYARIANDLQLEIDAAEIRVRAERRLGEIIIAQKESVGLGKPGRKAELPSDEEGNSRISLQDVGVDHKLSHRAQKTAGIAAAAFEVMVDRMRGQMSEGRKRVSLDLLKDGDKKEQRAKREMILAGIQIALPVRKYGVIYADPEWRFEVYSRDTGMDRAADNHYPTTATDAICERPVGDIAADDCALFLWATAPMMPDALRVMTAWGFEYKSQCAWVKDRIGTGYWFRNQHELLLVGTRGKVPAPAMGTQWPSVIEAPLGKHSAKPDRFYELIEGYFPNLPKIELNARRARDGWDAWGNEAPAEIVNPETGEITDPRKDYDDEGTDIPAFLGSAA